ncbi:hypothetical protein GKC68_00035 (plasmid) [Pantoea sp. RSPAM1]|uniref:STM4504/CBY_0614 family protein n=1 Tax=Pantoea sp. RSPAM1 TaxID=2675223 RepID=UPI00315CDD5B
MAIRNIFSKRQKRLRNEISDVYTYDVIQRPLKVQIIQIIKESIGTPSQTGYMSYRNEADKIYDYIHKTLSKEYGCFSLAENYSNDFKALSDFFLKESDAEKCMDFVELSFQVLEDYVAEHLYLFRDITRQKPDDAVAELNERFREHSVGYQFESGEIIRIDSQLIHSEVVKPTLLILSGETLFSGANEEFLAAHEHYRHKRYKECLNDCLKSFESLMKAIHVKKNWPYNPHDTASKLIASCLSHDLVPSYLQSQFTSLKTMLESGVPTIRNKNSGHGQGVDVLSVHEDMASYMLHLTATNLLFLAKCEKTSS